MAKFKIGDRVKCVRAVANNMYVLDKIGTIVVNDCVNYGVEFDEFIHGHGCDYNGKYGHCWWCRESALVKVVCSNKIVITADDKTTTAKMYDGKEVVKTAIAKCSPEDEFDFETGAKIAFDRLFVKPEEKSFDWDAFKNDEFFVQVTAYNFESFVKAAEKHGCFFHNHENPNPFKEEEFMFRLYVTSKYLVKPGDFFALKGTVLIGYKCNELGFTLHAVDNKPVYTW